MNIIYIDHPIFRNYSFKQKIKEKCGAKYVFLGRRKSTFTCASRQSQVQRYQTETVEEFSSLSSVDDVIYTSSDDLQVSEEIVSSSTQIFAGEIQVPVQKSYIHY